MIESNLFSTTMGRLAAGVWVTPALRSIVASSSVCDSFPNEVLPLPMKTMVSNSRVLCASRKKTGQPKSAHRKRQRTVGTSQPSRVAMLVMSATPF